MPGGGTGEGGGKPGSGGERGNNANVDAVRWPRLALPRLASPRQKSVLTLRVRAVVCLPASSSKKGESPFEAWRKEPPFDIGKHSEIGEKVVFAASFDSLLRRI